MKKIIFSIALATSLITPAQAHGRHGGYYESPYRPPYYPYNRGYGHRHSDTGDVLVPLIGGVIIGSIITNSQNRRQDPPRRPDPREYRYDESCDCFRR